jgi:Domain of unknown function (DUF4136)
MVLDRGVVRLKMSEFRLFCIVLLLLTASSALSQDIHYDFDDTANFSQFKTYKWVTLKSVAPIDKLTDEQIKAALGAALARKSLAKVDGDGAADLLIGYQTTGQYQEQFEGSPGWSPGPGWRATGSGKAWTIYQGELAVAMSDATKHVLVWRGVASKALDPKASPEKRQKNLNKAVTKLMKDYPPPK